MNCTSLERSTSTHFFSDKMALNLWPFALMHAWQNGAHESELEACARQAGFEEISRSSAVTPLIRFVPRCETTLLDAYLNPVLRSYMHKLYQHLSRQCYPGDDIQRRSGEKQ